MTGRRSRIRHAYDELATAYRDQRSDDVPAMRLLDTLTDRVAADAPLLDAGCGGGEPFTRELATTYDVTGLDFSREQLRLARDVVPDAALVQGDLTSLPFDADAFDVVCSFYAIIHVPTESHPTVISEFARVLRPGGWLLLTAGGDAWEGANDDWLDSGVRMEWSFPPLEETEASLSEVGFSVEDRWVVADELGGEFPWLLAQNV